MAMEIHTPKRPIHTSREFLKEVGIIVLGVLIALAAEQTVEKLHERTIASEARETIRAEARLDLGFMRDDRVLEQECIDHRLDQIGALLARARDGALDQPPSWIGRPQTAPMFMERWRSALASGRTSLLSAREQERYGQLYGLFERYDQHEAHEQQIWADLRGLENWQGALGAPARLAFAQSLQQARYEAWDLRYTAAYALRAGADLGIEPAPSNAGTAAATPVCLPMNTSRADALRTLNSPLGEP